MRVSVNRNRCTGMGVCESIAPAYFQVGDDGNMVLTPDIAPEDEELVAEAVRSCPASSLSIVAESAPADGD